MNKIKNRLKRWFETFPLFLFLLPVFFIYSGYNELFGFIPASVYTTNFFVVLLAVLLIFLISFLLFKHKKQAAFFCFFLSLVLLVFGYLHDKLKAVSPNGFITKYSFLIPFLTGVFTLFFYYIKKSKKNFNDAFLFLNVLFCVLVLSEIPNSIRRNQLDKSLHNLIDSRFTAFSEATKKTVPDSLKPDIFFLVFDELSSSKGLEQTLGKNNDELDSALINKGFYIALNAKSNYNWTIFSIISTLNMEYLPQSIDPLMYDPRIYFWGGESFGNNSTFKLLESNGYRIKQFQPFTLSNTDWKYETSFQELFTKHYYFKTMPGRFYRDLFWNYSKINNRYFHNYQMKLIDERNHRKLELFDSTLLMVKNACSFTGTPKFVYGHFMMPHGPFIVTRDGKLKNPAETVIKKKDYYLNAYYEQIKFTNKIIVDLVEFIQKSNKKNTVIIIEGDHGFRPENNYTSPYSFNNFSSFYFPDKNYNQLYDSISPVNTFRVVLNKYFQTNLTLVRDSCIKIGEAKELF